MRSWIRSAASALTGAALLALAACQGGKERAAAVADTAFRVAGFATPESVLHDPVADVYLVSNINGSPLEADDNGFISRLAPTGEVLALRWIDGAAPEVTLHAPKGMAIVGDTLYVTDITTVRLFQRNTGAPIREIPVAGTTFLNDLAAGPDGSLYLTDSGLRGGAQGFEPSGTDAVYRLGPGGVLDTLARGDTLGRPNGLAVMGTALWAVSFGSGELYQVSGGGKASEIKPPRGQLDGLEVVGDEVVFSSWEAQAVYRGPAGGPFTEVVTGVEAPADIGFDARRQRVLIPLFLANQVHIVPLTP
jgi:hypothetical protein